jgi:hypothetical protein
MSKLDLLQKYSPIVYFHSNERYFPASAEFLIKNSTLKNFNDGTTITSPTNKQLYDFAKNMNFEPKGDGSIVLGFDKEIHKGETPLSNVPIYGLYRKKDGVEYLTYAILLPYNGEYKILNMQDAGNHPGDLETYTIKLKNDGSIDQVFYASHGNLDGLVLDAKDVPMEDDKLVMYSALSGHGLYPKEGTVFRLSGLANDYLDKGYRWQPRVVELFPRSSPLFDPETMGWSVYNGRLGGKLDKPNTDGIMGLTDKVWWGRDGEEIITFDKSKLLMPNVTPPTRANKIFGLKNIILIALLTLLILIVNRFINSKISTNWIYSHMLTIILVIILYYFYNLIVKKVIQKFSPK